MIESTFQKKTWFGGLIFALFPILAQYKLPLMSYGFVTLFIYFLLKLFNKNSHLSFNKPMLLFVVFSLIQQLIVYTASGTFAENRNTYFFMLVCLFLLASANQINNRSFLNAYYYIGLVCCLLVLYQFFMGNVVGIPQSALQILPVSEENQHFWMADKNRASGLFAEPQAFASYILPLLIYFIYNRKFRIAIFVTVSIFASTSSQGIILAFIIWFVYFNVHSRSIVNKLLMGLFATGLVVLFLLVFRGNSLIGFVLDKILAIDLTYNVRLTKGFQIYYAMPFINKITGIGFGNLQNYLLAGGLDFFWLALTQKQLLGYITTMSNVLVSFGLGGFIFYMNIFKKNINTESEISKSILLVIFISSFTQTILFNSWYVYYWIIFELFDTINSDRYRMIDFHIRV